MEDRITFSISEKIPLLSGKVIHNCTFSMGSYVVKEDLEVFLDFLHFKKEVSCEFRLKQVDGTVCWCKARGVVFSGNRFVGNLYEWNQDEWVSAKYDPLTGLLTMQKFKEYAGRIVNEYPNRRFLILYFDIDNFKCINDLYGYHEGDIILREVAQYLSESNAKMQISARESADHFITMVLLQNGTNLKERVQEFALGFTEQQKRRNSHCNIRLTIGACIIDESQRDIVSAIDNANYARKQVKSNSIYRFEMFDDEMDQRVKNERLILSTKEQALREQEFLIYLQPKIELIPNKIVGAEALVRWRRPDGSMLQPGAFIPLFEENGFVLLLDFYVYQEVCKLIRGWLDEGRTVVPVSVNVSRLHLYQRNFVEEIRKLINEYQIAPKYIEFELTESILLDNTELAVSVMKELQSIGFHVSIDDFGAGYSSLNLLKDMKADVLKLDKGFFREGEMKRQEKIIVSNIINMAKQLDMRVLSEGVETKAQLEFLKEVYCDMAQGYFFAKPMPVQQFEEMIMGSKYET